MFTSRNLPLPFRDQVARFTCTQYEKIALPSLESHESFYGGLRVARNDAAVGVPPGLRGPGGSRIEEIWCGSGFLLCESLSSGVENIILLM